MKNFIAGALATLVLCTSFPNQSLAAGNLMVSPTRLVFEQGDRSAQVTLVNRGDKAGNFRISFIRQNMTENGDFVPVEEGEDGLFSDSMIRFSPRQIRLPPGQSQVVRMVLRRPADMIKGEYRSHMLFQALPEPSSTSVEAMTQQQSPEGITIELVPIVGVSIPVIVRQGDLQNSVTLTRAELIQTDASDQGPRLAVNINREGTGSAYGDLRATFMAEGSPPIVIAQANSVAVYANMQTRRFELPINLPAGTSLEQGEVNLVFLESGATEDSGILASTRLALN